MKKRQVKVDLDEGSSRIWNGESFAGTLLIEWQSNKLRSIVGRAQRTDKEIRILLSVSTDSFLVESLERSGDRLIVSVTAVSPCAQGVQLSGRGSRETERDAVGNCVNSGLPIGCVCLQCRFGLSDKPNCNEQSRRAALIRSSTKNQSCKCSRDRKASASRLHFTRLRHHGAGALAHLSSYDETVALDA
jgi:hypothetical protein